MNGEVSTSKAESYAIRYKSDIDGKTYRVNAPREHPLSLLIIGITILALTLFHGL